MTGTRTSLTRHDLAPLAHAAVGPARTLTATTRLRGGSKKDRLRLYRLAMHLSLVSGPLRLLDGDFPQPGPMRGIAEYNIQQTVMFLEDPNPRVP
ncbi:hypothetical protein [Streptomyces sp. R41]|uniref:Uncharacterized protein n=1 Tax=Streptomyces sp. R41 TaxID=3238632 RepID=A0AB39RMV2_9ACTN